MTVSRPAGNDSETGRRTTASSSQRSEVGSEHGEERRGAAGAVGASAVRMGPLLEIGSFWVGNFFTVHDPIRQMGFGFAIVLLEIV